MPIKTTSVEHSYHSNIKTVQKAAPRFVINIILLVYVTVDGDVTMYN